MTVSIDEVARRAGVSTATVSRALSGRGHVSDATRERVEAAAHELGYVVSASASSLASGRTRNIGVLVPFIDRWFFAAVLSGITATLMRHGYDITLYSLTTDAAQRREVFETFLRRRRVDGVIAVSLQLDEAETGLLRELGHPVIAIGGPNPRLPTLAVDEVAMARLATEHLLSLGHRDIGYIGAGAEFDVDLRIPTRRRHGFEQALIAAGVEIRPARQEPADFTLEGGFRATGRLLAHPGPRPTAIFAASDEMAIGALLASRERGCRVPEDLSLIGIDGHELGGFFQLTTIDQSPSLQGERAADAILTLLESGSTGDQDIHPDQVDLPFQLVVRGTTSPAAR